MVPEFKVSIIPTKNDKWEYQIEDATITDRSREYITGRSREYIFTGTGECSTFILYKTGYASYDKAAIAAAEELGNQMLIWVYNALVKARQKTESVTISSKEN